MNNNIITLKISDKDIQIYVRENARSKRLALKYHPIDDVFYLVKPPLAKSADISKFVDSSKDWLQNVISQMAAPVEFKAGITIQVLGENHLITYSYAEMPSVEQKDGVLHVSGFDPIIVPGLVKDWLRQHIYRFISDASYKFAERIQKKIGTITIKDTKSRWGSCSSDGNLSYSWRLAMAPLCVVEYVCAHEVCHLIEMNHSMRFWDLVSSLCPFYKRHKAWLKTNGKQLFRYI